MAEVALAAEPRLTTGSAVSRRLRKAGRIPATVYGHGTDATSISVDARELRNALSGEAGVNQLINLQVEGKKHLALARVVQKHPVRHTVSHIDFQVVNRNETLQAEVPINAVGEAEGVTKQGGIVEHVLTSLTVIATPTTIPSGVEVDISNLTLDDPVRVRDISLPSGVNTPLDPEDAVIIGSITRAAAGEAEEGSEAAGEDGAAPQSEDSASSEEDSASEG